MKVEDGHAVLTIVEQNSRQSVREMSQALGVSTATVSSNLQKIVTCDEKWINYDNRKRTGQWLDRDGSSKYFPKPKLHQQKMVIVWWSAIGVIHHSFLEANQSITAEVYCNQLAEIHAHLQKMISALVNRCGPILLHNKAKPHVTRMTLQKLTDLGNETLPHPPYSPDLSPADYTFLSI
ncbi:histone-lysine N-methyltransferase SETMAR-like [Octopus sinensis]|uniref:Histone-lysine N-methyltransferase SETMAR-like n=1 Tax=Octopus sinensis TaxID=2607531 RepID=A0A6P7SSI5_9MOLL|nr:histone-lysine N-methyltransferase SETMAR-like [Octopus sinensis]